MAAHVFIVMTNAEEGLEDEFNAWYDEQHIPDVLRVPGIKAVQRFRLSGKQRLDPPYPYKYLSIYEIESDDLDEVITPLKEWLGTERMPRSAAMKSERAAFFFEPITDRAVRPGD
ncbi:MAG: DUF4286 family protein [Janthinobacterium lividum]